jgi:hypothetical protein
MYPKTFFEENNFQVQSGKCFVLMPFANEFNEVYDTIREAVESPITNFVCERADDIRGGGHIMESVLKKIAESEIVIADLTGKNPNVFYELGITHLIKQPNKVILLIQDIDTLPFDLTPFRSISYKQSIAGAKQLKQDLQNAIVEVADMLKLRGENNNQTYQFRVDERQLYKFPLQLFGDGNCLYDFEIYGDYISEDGVKFTLSVTCYAAGHPPRKVSSDGYGLSGNMTRKIPKIPWNIKVHKLFGRTATFHLIHT